MMNPLDRPRLFVDMDGTLAVWNTLEIDIKRFEEVRNIRALVDEILYLDGYYEYLSSNQNVVDAVDDLIQEDEVDVYVMTCVMDDKDGVSPREGKRAWLKNYLPNLPEDHYIFVPDGEDKSIYIPGSISKNDYLLDDYTHNLALWEMSGGTGIKFLNGVNHTKQTWLGNMVSYTSSASALHTNLNMIIQGKSHFRDLIPGKKVVSPMTKEDMIDYLAMMRQEKERA